MQGLSTGFELSNEQLRTSAWILTVGKHVCSSIRQVFARLRAGTPISAGDSM